MIGCKNYIYFCLHFGMAASGFWKDSFWAQNDVGSANTASTAKAIKKLLVTPLNNASLLYI